MSQEIHPIIESLKQGEVILHQADTVWGLCCDATQAKAVQKVDALKGRSEGKSYIVLVKDEAMMERYVRKVPEVAFDLIESSVDPMTIIYPEGVGLAPGVCAADGSIAIRIVNDPLTKNILERLRRPLVSTSANRSGEAPPTRLSEVHEEIRNGVAHTVTRELELPSKKPSTIIKLSLNGEFKIIRS